MEIIICASVSVEMPNDFYAKYEIIKADLSLKYQKAWLVLKRTQNADHGSILIRAFCGILAKACYSWLITTLFLLILN